MSLKDIAPPGKMLAQFSIYFEAVLVGLPVDLC
jgi:hypothetical protein